LACAAESEGFQPKKNNPNPEPKGSGEEYCETKPTTRLLAAAFSFQ